jgi:hypothetical protein
VTRAPAIHYDHDKVNVVPRDQLQPIMGLAPIKLGASPKKSVWCVLFLTRDEAWLVTGAEPKVNGCYTELETAEGGGAVVRSSTGGVGIRVQIRRELLPLTAHCRRPSTRCRWCSGP